MDDGNIVAFGIIIDGLFKVSSFVKYDSSFITLFNSKIEFVNSVISFVNIISSLKIEFSMILNIIL